MRGLELSDHPATAIAIALMMMVDVRMCGCGDLRPSCSESLSHGVVVVVVRV